MQYGKMWHKMTGVKNAGKENAALDIGSGKCGKGKCGTKLQGVENAGKENVAQNHRCGKCGKGKCEKKTLSRNEESLSHTSLGVIQSRQLLHLRRTKQRVSLHCSIASVTRRLIPVACL